MNRRKILLAGLIALIVAALPVRRAFAEEEGDEGERRHRERAEGREHHRGERRRRGGEEEKVDEEAEAAERAHEAEMRRRETEMRKKLDKNISLNLVKADVAFVVGKVSQMTGINIVLAKDVLEEKENPVTVTMNLEDVTAEQAIRVIARQNWLKVEFEPGLIFIDWKPDPEEIAEMKIGEVTIRSGQVTLRLDIRLGDLEEDQRVDLIRTAAGRAMREGGQGMQFRFGGGEGMFGPQFQERMRRAFGQGGNPEEMQERMRDMRRRRFRGRRGDRDRPKDDREDGEKKPQKPDDEHAF